jgi:hypothetical protein
VQSAIAAVVLPPDPAEAANTLASEVTGESVPTDLGKKLLAAEAKHEAANAQKQVLRLAETKAGSELYSEFVARAEEIVTEHLRPALDQTLEMAGKLAPKLKGASSTDELLRANDEDARKAWLELGERLLPRFRAIREGYDLVYSAVFAEEVGASSLDLRDLLAFRNFDQLPKGQGGRVAGPTDQVQSMVWLVTGSGSVTPEPWLPLPDEIEDALEANVSGSAISR